LDPSTTPAPTKAERVGIPAGSRIKTFKIHGNSKKLRRLKRFLYESHHRNGSQDDVHHRTQGGFCRLTQADPKIGDGPIENHQSKSRNPRKRQKLRKHGRPANAHRNTQFPPCADRVVLCCITRSFPVSGSACIRLVEACIACEGGALSRAHRKSGIVKHRGGGATRAHRGSGSATRVHRGPRSHRIQRSLCRSTATETLFLRWGWGDRKKERTKNALKASRNSRSLRA
jgi:hypothetical protein